MEKRFAAGDGVEIVYDDLGEGIPVVLCHGIAAAGAQLFTDAEYFAGRGFRVLVPDLRGHGRSGKPKPLNRDNLSIGRLATDMKEMLDHAGIGPVHWVGNSLGGIVALWLLKDHEARFRTLTTFGTAYRLSLPGFWARLLPAAHQVVGAPLIGWMTAQTTTRNVLARPLIGKLVAGFDPQVAAPLTENLANYDLIANGAGATLPILMLRGGRDGAVNAALGSALAAMQGKANFTLVELPEGGHCANLDATEMWRGELEGFWAGR